MTQFITQPKNPLIFVFKPTLHPVLYYLLIHLIGLYWLRREIQDLQVQPAQQDQRVQPDLPVQQVAMVQTAQQDRQDPQQGLEHLLRPQGQLV
jgi:hypothetical protein